MFTYITSIFSSWPNEHIACGALTTIPGSNWPRDNTSSSFNSSSIRTEAVKCTYICTQIFFSSIQTYLSTFVQLTHILALHWCFSCMGYKPIFEENNFLTFSYMLNVFLFYIIHFRNIKWKKWWVSWNKKYCLNGPVWMHFYPGFY